MTMTVNTTTTAPASNDEPQLTPSQVLNYLTSLCRDVDDAVERLLVHRANGRDRDVVEAAIADVRRYHRKLQAALRRYLPLLDEIIKRGMAGDVDLEQDELFWDPRTWGRVRHRG